jgi:hypothetical protein
LRKRDGSCERGSGERGSGRKQAADDHSVVILGIGS